jgi:alcohol dehydrogenase class IV
MPRSLAAVGVHPDKMAKIAEYTMDDIWGKTNPRPISGPADVMEILELAK